MVEKQVPDSFLKKSRLSISLDHQSKVLHSLFLFSSGVLSKYIETKVQAACFYVT